jgi:DNA adenine methylase
VRNAVRPPFPYYGGKQLLAERLIALLPAHGCYVEPYAGSLSVLLAKPRVKLETVNDLNGDLVNFWKMLRERSDDLEALCKLTPHSRAEQEAAKAAAKNPDDLFALAASPARPYPTPAGGPA